jgi:copper chaperone NosL
MEKMRMNRTWMLLILSVLTLIIASGCGEKEYKPVAVKEGVDKCEVCQMLIKDDHNATEIILKDGKALKFDDIGDMFVWLKEHGRDDTGAVYVRDYKTKEWIELDKATYVYDKSNKTPMSFGVFSFKSEADADSFIKEKGTGHKMTAKDLDSHDWQHAAMGGHTGSGTHNSSK